MNGIQFKTTIILVILLMLFGLSFGQNPTRVGTTTAAFLEVGYGSAGAALGDAYVSMVNDISGIYWNPAGLAFMKKSEASFAYQPWIVDINTAFVGAGLVIEGVGTLGLGMINADYGRMDVTTVEYQEGTGETFTANDYALSVSYARALTNWFAFGASGKYVHSKVWHMNASAIALDLGVIVTTTFFSPTGKRGDGMRIGMSISNYGTRMRYDGIDLLNPIDIAPDERGNYAYTSGQFRPSEWELPLIFRIGASIKALRLEDHLVTLSFDALHPNNSGEYVNAGMEYELNMPGTAKFFLRGGYKGLFLDKSQYGFAIGGGLLKYIGGNMAIKVDYGFRDIGILGNVHSYTVGILF